MSERKREGEEGGGAKGQKRRGRGERDTDLNRDGYGRLSREVEQASVLLLIPEKIILTSSPRQPA